MKVLALVIMLLLPVNVYAQSFFIPQDVPPLPAITFDAKEIVEILSDYNLIMEDNPTFCRNYYGMTDFDTRTISICARIDASTKRITLLHELLHVAYHRIGIDTGGPYEPQIDSLAKELHRKLYGIQANKETPVQPQEVQKVQ